MSCFVSLLLSVQSGLALADSESDALSLTSAEAPKAKIPGDARLFFEVALGDSSQRYVPGSESLVRGSFDLSIARRFQNGLQLSISDRLDWIDPRVAGLGSTVNSLREAYLSFQPIGGSTVVEFGRINLRYGPGYGYNPTDFFRDGTLRAMTTADPFALRENRLGTVMARYQYLWKGGAFSFALSPKLANAPNAEAWSLDLGSTNNRDRALITISAQVGSGVSGQILAYWQDQRATSVGANLTALLSDSTTAHMEWSVASEPDLLSQLASLPAPVGKRSRLVGGFTFTSSEKLSLTAEYHYNGFGLGKARWQSLATLPLLKAAFLAESLRVQDLAPSRALLIYATKKNFLIPDMDLTGYVRVNLIDNSKLYWVELRRRWTNFDLAFQLQQNSGGVGSEFGVLPERRILQVLGTYYF